MERNCLGKILSFVIVLIIGSIIAECNSPANRMQRSASRFSTEMVRTAKAEGGKTITDIPNYPKRDENGELSLNYTFQYMPLCEEVFSDFPDPEKITDPYHVICAIRHTGYLEEESELMYTGNMANGFLYLFYSFQGLDAVYVSPSSDEYYLNGECFIRKGD